MSFGLALAIVLSVAAIALGLVAHHLLRRLDTIENAVHGGLGPPSRRLSRFEFESRFNRATARAELARDVVSGLVVVVGAEFANSELRRALEHLERTDGLVLASAHPTAQTHLAAIGARIIDLDDSLGVTVTPFAFVVDEAKIRSARPIVGSDDLVRLLHSET